MVNVDEAFEVRYKKSGEEVQVLVDFDELKKYKEKPEEIDMYNVLADTKIFKDQKKGEIAPEDVLKKIFGGKSEEEMLKEILLEGEPQIPTAYLNKMRDEKKEQIINYIATNAINTQTKTKVSASMVEREFENITYNVNPDRSASSQAEEVIKLLKKAMPIVIDKSIIELSAAPQYVGKFYGPFRSYGRVTKEFYDESGNLHIHIEVTSGIVDDVIEYIKRNTNNEASYRVSNS